MLLIEKLFNHRVPQKNKLSFTELLVFGSASAGTAYGQQGKRERNRKRKRERERDRDRDRVRRHRLRAIGW